MKFCKKCGTKLESDAGFCPECGTPVVDSKPSQKKPEEKNDDYQTQLRGKPQSYSVLHLENLPEGHIIDERYEIKEKVGQGGFGAVYRVFDRNMEIDKALKIIPEAIVSDKEAMFDLQSEAKTMITLNHANIVRVYDFHKTGSIKFIDMEYVDGKTLTEIKLEHPNKQIPETKVKELALKIAEGMAYAHENNVLHKDIKPQNIKVTSKGDIKIMDFGIAETVRTSMSRIQNTSSSGTLVYMSPEQIKGKDVGKESDIYSFGAVLYELLSGHPPFYKGDINHQILNEKPELLDNISEKMNAFLMTCLQKEYRNRFKNFTLCLQSLANELQQKFSGSKISDRPVADTVKPFAQLEIPEMVFVRGGTFQMGSNDGDSNEKPVHSVTLSDFYIGKYEVTQKEWQEVMGNTPSNFKGDNLPVEKVSWYDAVEFCNKQSDKEGITRCYSGSGKNITCNFNANGYRLPTEAEWEYAARGGNNARYYKYSGSNTVGNVAWCEENSGKKTHPVGGKKANEIGIYDMSGNVWEWCWDWYSGYNSGSQTNTKGPSSGSLRVLRGGSWFRHDGYCRVAGRNRSIPDLSSANGGFRFLRNSR